jgi:hypothetical protein
MRRILWILTAVLLVVGCGSDQPNVKNRVPTVQGELDAAQQASRDAKAAADSAAQTKKDIQAAIDKLNGAQANSDGSIKIDRPQTTNPGIVTSVGEAKSRDGEITHYTFWFTFAERGGYVKTFDHVCDNQSIPGNGTVILNFHWHPYDGSDSPGCYALDGYTVGW